MRLILIGFMGCGKSTIGKRLAEELKIPMLDTDTLIEQEAGMAISQIFAEQGEPAFREMERACIRRLILENKDDYILSTGGGLPVQPGNDLLLKELGEVIWLYVSPEEVFARLKGDTTRPLLQGDDPLGRIRELSAAREDAYRSCADRIVSVDKKEVEQIVEEIKDIWQTF